MSDPDIIFSSLKREVNLDEVFGEIWALGIPKWKRYCSEVYEDQLKLKIPEEDEVDTTTIVFDTGDRSLHSGSQSRHSSCY